MARLDMMFRQSLEDEGPVKQLEQDEDVDSDEDIVEKNRADTLFDLGEAIQEFELAKKLKTKRDLVRNYANNQLTKGRAGFMQWEL